MASKLPLMVEALRWESGCGSRDRLVRLLAEDYETKKTVLKVVPKDGYEVRTERWVSDYPDVDMEITLAYTPDGHLIGEVPMAKSLVGKLGIRPELASPTHSVCSVGYSPKDKKWYGWSHRAICGFGLGDRVFDERYGDDSTPFVKHGREVIRDMDGARRAAVAFAGSVS